MSSLPIAVSRDTARRAWQSLQGHGTATRDTVSLVTVGLSEYLDAFAERYLGEEGVGTCKLLLGSNGEGKTHFLFSVRARALQLGHLVAIVEAPLHFDDEVVEHLPELRPRQREPSRALR